MMPLGRSRSRRRAGRATRPRAVAIAAVPALSAAASAETITGTAFEGSDTPDSRPLVDSGVDGITVTAYGSDGTAVASSSRAVDGRYTLNVPGGAGTVRVELTGLPAGHQPARRGASSRTAVRSVTGSGSGVDVGVLQPASFCQDNPELAITCRAGGVT